jgi:hypothetical protein
MKDGVKPEPKLHGSFVGRGAGSRLWASEGFIVFVSCGRMAASVNLRRVSKRFYDTLLDRHVRVAWAMRYSKAYLGRSDGASARAVAPASAGCASVEETFWDSPEKVDLKFCNNSAGGFWDVRLYVLLAKVSCERLTLRHSRYC